MKKTLFFAGLICWTASGAAQSPHSYLREGDGKYVQRDFAKAEESYRKAQEIVKTDQGNFNLGNAVYSQGRYDEALKQYDETAKKAADADLKADAQYNAGNAHFQKNEYDKAVDAYKQELKIHPNDAEGKLNLALAMRQLKKQQQQQQKKDPPKKDQQQKQKQQQQQDQQQQQQQQQDQQNQPPPQDVKQQEAQNLLRIMDNEERKVQQRMRKGEAKPSKSNKDW